MEHQFLAQHKQDYISLSSMASSLAAQILADLREEKKSPNKPDDRAAIRQVYNMSPLLLPRITRIPDSAGTVSQPVRQVSYKEFTSAFVHLFDNAASKGAKQGTNYLSHNNTVSNRVQAHS